MHERNEKMYGSPWMHVPAAATSGFLVFLGNAFLLARSSSVAGVTAITRHTKRVVDPGPVRRCERV